MTGEAQEILVRNGAISLRLALLLTCSLPPSFLRMELIYDIGFSDYINCIKQWAQKALPVHFYDSEEHVLEALENLFEKEGTSLLNIEAFSEVNDEDFAPEPPSVRRNIVKSFQEAELIKCVVRLVWLELISDASPEE